MASIRRVSWKTQPPQAIESLLAAFESDTRTLGAFAAYKGVAANGFRQAAISLYPERFAAAMATKKRKTAPGKRGYAFEYRVLQDLLKRGLHAMRSPGSRGAADLVAFATGRQYFVQAKVNGAIRPAERKALVELARSVGATPVLAERTDGSTLGYWEITLGTERKRIEPHA